MRKSGDVTQDGDSIWCEMGPPAYFPCGYVVETRRLSRPAATDSEEELLHPDSDAVWAQSPGYRNAAAPPPKEDALPTKVGIYQDPSIFAPLGIDASESMQPVTRDLQEFIEKIHIFRKRRFP